MKTCSKQETIWVSFDTRSDRLHSMIYLVKGHQLAIKREIEDSIRETQFTDLKEKPLGSVPSILFWNNQQKQISTQVEKMKHTLLKGDYGTGLCVILS